MAKSRVVNYIYILPTSSRTRGWILFARGGVLLGKRQSLYTGDSAIGYTYLRYLPTSRILDRQSYTRFFAEVAEQVPAFGDMFSKFPEQLRLPHHLLAKKKKKEKPQDVEKATTQSTSSGHAEGHSTNGIFVRDSIIGFADGLTVPFALTAGLSSLGSSKVVILGGLAELFAGSISMGLGAYLAAKTDLKHYEVEEKRERREVKDCPAAEEEEIYDIFDQYGIPRLASAGVVESLKKDEDAWVKARRSSPVLLVGMGMLTTDDSL